MSERVAVGDAGLDQLAAAFPCWRIWQSRPHGLWWATRRGRIRYHDLPRRPGWGITIGGVPTLAELGAQLAMQRELDDPEPLPASAGEALPHAHDDREPAPRTL